MFYLSGFAHGHAGERLLALIVRRDGTARWIVPAMNAAQVAAHAADSQPVRAWGDAEGYLPALREALAGTSSVAFDDEARAAFLLDALSASPSLKVVRAGTIMRSLRIRKDAAELDALRAAGRTVDQTIAQARSFCRPGRTELDVERDLRAALLARSPDSAVAFTIVASGPNGAFPHHETAGRTIRQGDVVIIDFGTRGPGGYHSDVTITCAAGEPADAEARQVYRIVRAAQQAAIDAVRPGATCGSIDHAARQVIEDAGYGEFFIHRTGHGLGLQVHEPPFLVAVSEDTLGEGMVFSIEPGIYLPGRFGVRLEVIASVTASGANLINAPSAPELPIIC